MTAMDARTQLRIRAAELALDESRGQGITWPAMEKLANNWFAWLISPEGATLQLTVVVTDQHGRVKTVQTSNGGSMGVQMTVDDTLTVVAAPEDDHGDPTSDVLSFTGSDGGTVLTLAENGNTCTATPVAEGTATITISDPASPDLAPATVDVTVGAGPTASVQVTTTVNTGANAAPPAPAG